MNKNYSVIGYEISSLNNRKCVILVIETYRVSEDKVFFFNLALRERNIQVRLYLKVVLKSLDMEILIFRTNFQKSIIGWPQQPPTEKVQKLINDIS